MTRLSSRFLPNAYRDVLMSFTDFLGLKDTDYNDSVILRCHTCVPRVCPRGLSMECVMQEIAHNSTASENESEDMLVQTKVPPNAFLRMMSQSSRSDVLYMMEVRN